MSIRVSATAAAVPVALSILSFPLHAAPVQVMPVVLVTATRFPAAEADSIGVSVITEEEIRASTATSVSEVLQKLGGVHVRPNLLGTPDAAVDLRGFGITGDQNTLVLVNGRRLSEFELSTAKLSSIPLNAIERIEIQRGSGAVLYGGGATGGVINIITAPATARESGGAVYGSYGSYATGELRANVNGGGENWGLALFANHLESDNYRRNNEVDLDNVSGELRWLGAADQLFLRFGSNRQSSRLPGFRTEQELQEDRRGTATPNDAGSLEGWNASVGWEHSRGEASYTVEAGIRDQASRFHNEFSGGTFDQSLRSKVLTLSPRARWQGKLGAADNTLVAGADWSDWSYRNDNTTVFFGFPFDVAERAGQRNGALYLYDSLALPAGTTLALGGRRERVRFDLSEELGPVPETGKKLTLSAWEASLRQEIGGGFSTYLRFGQSFRVANIDENRCFAAPCTLLEPQKSHERELGAEWRRGAQRLRASVFRIDLSNEIHFNRLEGFVGANVNLPPTRRSGVELEGATRVGAVDLTTRYAYTRARFRAGTSNGIDLAGNEVPAVPRHRAGITAGWQVFEQTRLTATANYVGRQRYDNDQANRFRRMPAYTVVDLKLSQGLGRRIVLSAGINNLFDEKYYPYALVTDPVAPATFVAYPDPERNGYVAVEWRW